MDSFIEKPAKSSPFLFSKPNWPVASLKNGFSSTHSDLFVPEDFQATPLLHYNSKQSSFERLKKDERKHNKLDGRGDVSTYFAFKEGINHSSWVRYTSTPQSQLINGKGSVENEIQHKILKQLSPIFEEASLSVKPDNEFHFQPRLMIGKSCEDSHHSRRKKSTDSQEKNNISSEALCSSQASSSEKSMSNSSEFLYIATKIPTPTETQVYNTDSSFTSPDSGSFKLSKQTPQSDKKASFEHKYQTHSSLSSLSRYKQQINLSTEEFEEEDMLQFSNKSSGDLDISKPSLSDIEDDFEYKPCASHDKVTVTKESVSTKSPKQEIHSIEKTCVSYNNQTSVAVSSEKGMPTAGLR